MSLDHALNGAPDWTEPGPLTPITPAEVEDLAGLEQVIEGGLVAFVAVGSALAEVRDRRLYRADFPTFEAYCDARWGISRRRAYDLMDSAAVVCAIGAQAPLIANERQARALGGVPPEERAEVMSDLAATGKPITAKAIEEHPKHPKPAADPEPDPSSSAATPPAPSPGPPAVETGREPHPDDDDLCESCGEHKPDAIGGWCAECWEASEAASSPAPKPKAEKPPSEKMWETAKVMRKGFNEMPSAREVMAMVPADDMADLIDLANQAIAWGKAFKEDHKAAARLRLMGVK